ncbi:MAG TPA: site-specific DNA-methyltransferase [Candidatus Acidoferrum sp.]|nr:site-specific DNA-methyltransferase [Candidatus Acidoferrum sp.]
MYTTVRATNGFKLNHSDCVRGMAAMDPKSVDVVVTSPPYNLGIKYTKFADDQSREEYLAWCGTWIKQLRRVIADDGALFLNIGSSPSNPLLPFQLALEVSKHLVLQNTFHWIKAITVEPRGEEQFSVGHFKPISSHRFVNDCHEYVFHFTHSGNVRINRLAVGVPYADKSNIARWSHTKGKDLRCRGNTWFVPYKTITSRDGERPHPATFPVGLATRCFQIHGVKDTTKAMEPFLGIGTAAEAALECGIAQFTGFEIDEVYLEFARQRIGLR